MSHAANTWSMVACSQPPRKLPYHLGENSPPLAVSEGDRTQLQRVANSTTMPPALVPHARMPFANAEGLTNLRPRTASALRRKRPASGASAISTPASRGSVTNSDPAAPLRRRTGRPGDRPCLARKARGRHPLEHPRHGRGHLGQHRLPLVPSLRPQAAPSQDLQAVRGPLLHRESPRYRGALHRYAGSCHGAPGGRAIADPRLGTDPAATALGQRLCRAAISRPGPATPHRAVSAGSSVRGSGSVSSPCGAAGRGPGTAWWA